MQSVTLKSVAFQCNSRISQFFIATKIKTKLLGAALTNYVGTFIIASDPYEVTYDLIWRPLGNGGPNFCVPKGNHSFLNFKPCPVSWKRVRFTS